MSSQRGRPAAAAEPIAPVGMPPLQALESLRAHVRGVHSVCSLAWFTAHEQETTPHTHAREIEGGGENVCP